MPIMPIHSGANRERPVGVLPRMHIKAIIERLASRQAAVFVYMFLLHTVMWNQMVPCEHPTEHKPQPEIIR